MPTSHPKHRRRRSGLRGAAALLASLATLSADPAAADLDCAEGALAYRIDWSGYAAHERSLTGRPSAVVARHDTAPPLVIGLDYAGAWQALDFDHPKVLGDADSGGLRVRQTLAATDQAAAITFRFPLHISRLQVTIPDLDTETTMTGAQGDRIEISASRSAPIQVRLHGRGAGSTQARLRAERTSRDDLPREGMAPIALAPVVTPAWGLSPFYDQTAIIGSHRSRLDSITFAIGVEDTDTQPVSQSVTLTDAHLCVPDPDGQLAGARQ